ncbi:DUF3077 domain-containing protein [Azonexus sp.]|uniref:DUF3077 domain-containing protein n=1 Tax=Azonexus sp. TaxID=1872668 RepID=UPI0035AE56E3
MKTIAIPFFKCNSQGDELFSVNADVPADSAMSEASCLLSAACALLKDEDSEWAYGALALIQMAKAAIDAVEVNLD